MISYIYIAITIVLTVYGQLIIKWQVGQANKLPDGTIDKIFYLLRLCFNPWIISAFIAAFIAALAWMAAINRMPLSHAYPFIGTTFVLVLLGSGLFFGESITLLKLSGTGLIALGIIVASQG